MHNQDLRDGALQEIRLQAIHCHMIIIFIYLLAQVFTPFWESALKYIFSLSLLCCVRVSRTRLYFPPIYLFTPIKLNPHHRYPAQFRLSYPHPSHIHKMNRSSHIYTFLILLLLLPFITAQPMQSSKLEIPQMPRRGIMI